MKQQQPHDYTCTPHTNQHKHKNNILPASNCTQYEYNSKQQESSAFFIIIRTGFLFDLM